MPKHFNKSEPTCKHQISTSPFVNANEASKAIHLIIKVNPLTKCQMNGELKL